MAVDYSKIITDICKDILKLTDMFPYFIIAAVLITCFIYTIFRWHNDAMHFQIVQEDAGMRYGRIYILGYD